MNSKEYLNKGFEDNSTLISDFLDLHFYVIAAFFIPSLFMYTSLANHLLTKNHHNNVNVYAGLDISNVDITLKSDVLKYFALNFSETILEHSEETLKNSCHLIVTNEAFFNFVKKIFADKAFVNSFFLDIPLHLRSEYIKIFENLKICNSVEEFSNIFRKEESVIEIIQFIKRIYKIQ